MTKPRFSQESAARIAVTWMHLRPAEVPAVAKSLARNIYAALVRAGVSGPEANDLAAEAICCVMHELIELWTPPEHIH